MGLADRLAEPDANRGGGTCSLCILLPGLAKAERDALTTALQRKANAGGWSARFIAEQMQAEGYNDITKYTVEHHRREHMQ